MPPMLAPIPIPTFVAVESISIGDIFGWGTPEDGVATELIVVVDRSATDVEEIGEIDDRESELEICTEIWLVTEGSSLAFEIAVVGAAAEVGNGRDGTAASAGTEFNCA